MGLKPATRIYLDIFGDLIIELLTEWWYQQNSAVILGGVTTGDKENFSMIDVKKMT